MDLLLKICQAKDQEQTNKELVCELCSEKFECTQNITTSRKSKSVENVEKCLYF